MKINILEKKITLKDSQTQYIEKKISKLDKFFKSEAQARIVAGTIKDNAYIEAAIYADGMIYRAEVTDVSFLASIDRIVDLIERQIRKNKTRLEKKIRREATNDSILLSGATYTDGEDNDEFKIVKVKKFKIKPMTCEEAVLQMRLLGHDFFVFQNSQTFQMNVVYKRKDGNYALIESIE